MSTTIDRAPRLLRRDVPAKQPRGMLRRLLLASGIGASLLYVAANVFGPMQWQGYSTVDQQICELFAVDAPSRPLVVSLLFAYGVLALAFGIGVVWSAGQNRALRAAGWALVGIGVVDQVGPFFPMHTREVLAAGGDTVSDTMHITLTIVISLLTLLAMGFGAAAFGMRFRRYSIVTMVTLVVSGALTSLQAGAMAADEPTPWMGSPSASTSGPTCCGWRCLRCFSCGPNCRPEGTLTGSLAEPEGGRRARGPPGSDAQRRAGGRGRCNPKLQRARPSPTRPRTGCMPSRP